MVALLMVIVFNIMIAMVHGVGIIGLDTSVKHRPFLDPDGRQRIFHG
jgi:hypothetical protein